MIKGGEVVEGCENVKEREDVSTLKLFRKTGNEMGGRSGKRVKGEAEEEEELLRENGESWKCKR